MKVIKLNDTSLFDCISDAQREKIVITRNGKPVALVIGVLGLDTEQLELGSDPAFWELIARRRRQRALTRTDLDQKLRGSAGLRKRSGPLQ